MLIHNIEIKIYNNEMLVHVVYNCEIPCNYFNLKNSFKLWRSITITLSFNHVTFDFIKFRHYAKDEYVL